MKHIFDKQCGNIQTNQYGGHLQENHGNEDIVNEQFIKVIFIFWNQDSLIHYWLHKYATYISQNTYLAWHT